MVKVHLLQTFAMAIGLLYYQVIIRIYDIIYIGCFGALAEQLRSGLQNRLGGCNSHRCLHITIRFMGEWRNW